MCRKRFEDVIRALSPDSAKRHSPTTPQRGALRKARAVDGRRRVGPRCGDLFEPRPRTSSTTPSGRSGDRRGAGSRQGSPLRLPQHWCDHSLLTIGDGHAHACWAVVAGQLPTRPRIRDRLAGGRCRASRWRTRSRRCTASRIRQRHRACQRGRGRMAPGLRAAAGNERSTNCARCSSMPPFRSASPGCTGGQRERRERHSASGARPASPLRRNGFRRTRRCDAGGRHWARVPDQSGPPTTPGAMAGRTLVIVGPRCHPDRAYQILGVAARQRTTSLKSCCCGFSGAVRLDFAGLRQRGGFV